MPSAQRLLAFLLSLLCCNQAIGSASKLTCQLMDDAPPMTDLTLVGEFQTKCRLLPGGFRILPTPYRRLNSYFNVRPPASTLSTSRQVDLEELCLASGSCCNRELPNCTIGLMLLNGVTTVEIDVVIVDRNDHGPVFSRTTNRLELSERREPDSQPHSKIDLPIAADADRQQFGVLRYELQPNDTVFQLEEIRRDRLSEPIPVLKQRGHLDRETRASYSFVLYAIDRGDPSLTGSTSIIVTVADVNDNKPVFDQIIYSANVNESIQPGQVVLCVNATDLDEGEYGRVRYSIKTPPGGQAISDFNVNTVTGCLFVARQLDYETTKEYVFSVVAADGDRSPNSAEAEVKINIQDVNDCSPEIAIHLSSPDGILEGNRTADLLVALVTVTDLDSGAGGSVTCWVAPPNKYRLELASMSVFHLWLNASLDREAASTVEISVCCADHGNPSRDSCQSRSINVRDVNDEAPKFKMPVYHASVAENISQTLLPSYVIGVEAVDRDEGPVNNMVTYSIGAESREYFSIDNRTGVVKAWRALDRETHSGFVIAVTAQDPEGLRDTATVSVSVRDINDNAPTVHYPRGQMLEVPENCSISTLVGLVEASDPDEGEFARTRFVLLPSRMQLGWLDFRIDSTSGRIFTSRQLDRERQQTYELRILVIDNPSGGSSQQNSVTATLTVRVLDINDNSPEIQFPTVENNTFRVSWREPAFQPVLQVRAVDRDEAENGMLRYELRQLPAVGRGGELFFIDPTDGKIRINRQMTQLDIGDQHLTVRVFDCALESPRWSQISLIIRVDRSSPKFLPAVSPPPSHDGPPRRPDGGGGGGGGGGDGYANDVSGRPRSDSGSILVAAVGLACALTLILLAVALCLCHRRGLFAELLGTASDEHRPQQQQQQQRMRRKGNGGEDFGAGGGGGGGGGQLEALAFLGSGNRRADGSRDRKTFPSVTSSLNQSDATAVTFDETANYVTYGGGRMQRRQRAPSCTRNDPASMEKSASASASQQQQQSSADCGYQEALSCSEGRPPTYYDLATSASRGSRQRTPRVPAEAEFVQLLARSGSAGNLLLQQQQQPQQKPPPLPLSLSPAGAPCTDHVTRKRFADSTPDGHRAASVDLLEAGDHTLKHHGKLYSIPKASYV